MWAHDFDNMLGVKVRNSLVVSPLPTTDFEHGEILEPVESGRIIRTTRFSGVCDVTHEGVCHSYFRFVIYIIICQDGITRVSH